LYEGKRAKSSVNVFSGLDNNAKGCKELSAVNRVLGGKQSQYLVSQHEMDPTQYIPARPTDRFHCRRNAWIAPAHPHPDFANTQRLCFRIVAVRVKKRSKVSSEEGVFRIVERRRMQAERGALPVVNGRNKENSSAAAQHGHTRPFWDAHHEISVGVFRKPGT